MGCDPLLYRWGHNPHLTNASGGCGHPVDGPAQQEHRPNRQMRARAARKEICQLC